MPLATYRCSFDLSRWVLGWLLAACEQSLANLRQLRITGWLRHDSNPDHLMILQVKDARIAKRQVRGNKNNHHQRMKDKTQHFEGMRMKRTIETRNKDELAFGHRDTKLTCKSCDRQKCRRYEKLRTVRKKNGKKKRREAQSLERNNRIFSLKRKYISH